VVPEKGSHTIQLEKAMLTPAWNPTGFHLIDFLSPQANVNDTHYVTNMLSPPSLPFGAKLKSGRPIEN
jgi:hypothetical protein